MSLESSHEPAGLNLPRSAISSEIGHNTVVQRNSEEEFPASVTSASVPLDPDDFVAILLAWIRTSDWPTSQAYLQTHSELLTEAAAQVLTTLVQHQPDQQVRELLTLHQQLLQAVHQQGVEVAYQPLLHLEENDSKATEQEELQTQLITWLQTSDWETSQAYLQTHPLLLTHAAAQALEVLKRAQREEQIQAMISVHQMLLQEARVKGIGTAYEQRILAPELEIPPSAQEQEQFFHQLEEWIMTPDWEKSQMYLQAHPDLLTEAAEELLLSLMHREQTGQALTVLSQHQLLLRGTREGGIAATYQAFHNSATLNNLGNRLRNQYARAGELADLEHAIHAEYPLRM